MDTISFSGHLTTKKNYGLMGTFGSGQDLNINKLTWLGGAY